LLGLKHAKSTIPKPPSAPYLFSTGLKVANSASSIITPSLSYSFFLPGL